MIIKGAKFVRGAANWKGLSDDGLPEIAFVGRSNVGKSSLINMLVERRALARTSNTPGKTQQFNYYLINQNFYFVDLPGFGYAKYQKYNAKNGIDLLAATSQSMNHCGYLFILWTAGMIQRG